MTRPPAHGPTVPTALAALAAGVSEATVRKWVSRGKLTRYGQPRRAEYDLDELHRLMERRVALSPSLPTKARPP